MYHFCILACIMRCPVYVTLLIHTYMHKYLMGPDSNLNVAHYVCYILYKCYIIMLLFYFDASSKHV